MRVIQEIKVECATKAEYDTLMQWVEEQEFCTVEPTVTSHMHRPSIHCIVSITPWSPHGGDQRAQFDEFCAELEHAVSLNG